MDEIVRLLVEHGEDDHIVGNKGEKQRPIRFAHPLGLLNAAELVGLAVQVIQRAKEKHNVKGVVWVAAEVQGVALRQVDVVLWGQFGPESCDVGLGQLQSRYLVALSGEIQAIFSSPGPDIQNLGPRGEIALYVAHGGEKLHPGGLGAGEAAAFIQAAVQVLHQLGVVFVYKPLREVLGAIPLAF